MNFKAVRWCLVASLFVLPYLHAGPPPVQDTLREAADFAPFARGVHELEVSIGGFESIFNSGALTEPDTTYGLASIRFGRMLSDPSGTGIFRGNYEFLIGGFGGVIDRGPGNYLIGADAILRYNFVQPGARWVPFFQIGGGAAYSDAADADGVQRLIGGDFSFELQSAVGLRFMVSDHWSITASAQFQHFSNADLEDRNRGLNSIGALLGVSVYY
jgi:hypothetical protein